jgi:tungstate transport system ATP-binding protein
MKKEVRMKIEIKNLKKKFGKKEILNIERLNFKIGETTYLLGENGAGKSTLLNILAKIDLEYLGNIENIFLREEISLVDANPYMLKGDVYDNIAYPLKIRKIDNIDERVEKLLKKFDLERLKDKVASKLSSGETQKVAIVRALSYEPKLLLLDEPTANLDKDAKLELIEILRDYKKNGTTTTIIIVTHDHDFFENLKGEKIILNKIRS